MAAARSASCRITRSTPAWLIGNPFCRDDRGDPAQACPAGAKLEEPPETAYSKKVHSTVKPCIMAYPVIILSCTPRNLAVLDLLPRTGSHVWIDRHELRFRQMVIWAVKTLSARSRDGQ